MNSVLILCMKKINIIGKLSEKKKTFIKIITSYLK